MLFLHSTCYINIKYIFYIRESRNIGYIGGMGGYLYNVAKQCRNVENKPNPLGE